LACWLDRVDLLWRAFIDRRRWFYTRVSEPQLTWPFICNLGALDSSPLGSSLIDEVVRVVRSGGLVLAVVRWSLDMATAKEPLGEAWVTAHSKLTPVTTFRITGTRGSRA
jgi:hypothetical protein